MSWMYWSNPLRMMSPLGLVAVGAVAGATGVPVIKKTARKLAVLTVKGALTVSDAVKDVGSSVNKEWINMVEEARVKQVKLDAADMANQDSNN